VRLVILGAGGVGKSTFAVRYVQNEFVENYYSYDENYFRKQLAIGNESFMLDILDTASNGGRSISYSYGSGQGYIIMYSVTDLLSFSFVEQEYEQILRAHDVDSFPMVLVGTKSDLTDKREVTKQMGEAKAIDLGMSFFEVSSKTGVGNDDVFLDIVNKIRFERGLQEIFNEIANPYIPKRQKNSKCTIC